MRSTAFSAMFLLVLNACSSSTDRTSVPPIAEATRSQWAMQTTASVSGTSTSLLLTPVLQPSFTGPLSRFYRAIWSLHNKTRTTPVRIAWLGDSHAQADYLTFAFRSVFQNEFGNGGTGFLHLGYRGSRSESAKLRIQGKWNIQPRGPSTIMRTGNGVFGLGGIVTSSQDGVGNISIEPTGFDSAKNFRGDLCFRFTSSKDKLSLLIDNESEQIFSATLNTLQQLTHHEWIQSSPPKKITVKILSGTPDLCGLIAETTAPSIVMDNFGINGARMATPLAWDEESWITEAKRRNYDLVILEFGTNETSDLFVKPERYQEHMKQLLSRLRQTNPNLDCVVMAPTVRSGKEDACEMICDAFAQGAKDNGCFFWNTYAFMGGRGAIEAWAQENPPRAAGDGIHLNAKGYREVGKKLAEDVLYDYRTAISKN